MRAWRCLFLAALAAGLLISVPVPDTASARSSAKKGLWGPVEVSGRSQFPVYRRLGARLYSTRLDWSTAAPARPAQPRDPADPAYQWPQELDVAVREADRYGMRVAVDLRNAPRWANGDRPPQWVPRRISDWRDFVTAAVRRYPSVDYWIVWAEPTRKPNFRPLITQKGPAVKLDRARRRPVRTYARLLDSAYGAINRERPGAKVVGGNSFVGGDISPLNMIRHLKLPNGRRPRMDLYGHHPFTARRPDLSRKPIQRGLADFSDLDTLARWVDRYLGRDPRGRRIKLYLGEWSLASDHQSRTFNIWVSRRTQASWLRSALRIVRRWNRIEALVWLSLYDQPPAADGLETNWGLLDYRGRKKPSYDVFRRG